MKLDIVIHGNSNTTGFGIHARNVMKALYIAGKNVAFVPIQDMRYQIIDSGGLKICLENQQYITGHEPALMIYHASHMLKFCGQPRMGYAIFETDKIPEYEKRLYETLDSIFVPSKWGRTVLEENKIWYDGRHENEGKNLYYDTKYSYTDGKLIEIIPEGYDHDVFNVTQTPDEIIHRMRQRGYLTFIHIGKYEERKSTRTIIAAFQAAVEFTGIPAVLNMKVANPFDNQWHEDYAIAVAGDMNIRKCNRDNMTDDVMAKGYHDADFGLYASKGEAWGLPILEGIACGLPTITTQLSGMTEYLKEYPMQLKVLCKSKEIANDGKFFRGDKGNWYMPDYEDLVERIKFTLVNAEQIYRIDRQNCIDAVKDFTWEHAVRGII